MTPLKKVQQIFETLRKTRRKKRISQESLAGACSVHRMTISRAEDGDADVRLSTVVSMAAALGLSIGFEELPAENKPNTHIGQWHSRTLTNVNLLEKALANAWQAENSDGKHILADLIPGYTDSQAKAAATIVQWLGSNVGFAFLCEVMNSAGITVERKE